MSFVEKTRFEMIFVCFVFLLYGAADGIAPVPPHSDVANMARYIIHNSDWVSVATISTMKGVESYPFVTLKSMSDGPIESGSGVPYLYMTTLDLSGKDIEVDNRVTIMCSLEQSGYCSSEHYDPQDPRCARVIISGKMGKVPTTTQEYVFAENALFTRHPAMKDWPTGHNFYIAKVDIEQVVVLDYFGGAKVVPVEKYFHPNESLSYENILFEEIAVMDVRF